MSWCKQLKPVWVCFILVGVAGSSVSVGATELGSCDPDTDPYACECPDELQDYERCSRLSESDLLNPADAQNYRSAIALQFYYDPETDHTEIHSDFSRINGGGILPIHKNGGYWRSYDELFDYMEVLLSSDAQDLICDGKELPRDGFFMTGQIFRWNQFDGTWAANQVQDPILAAISDANGDIWVDQDLVGFIDQLASGCQTKTDDIFTGTQCADAFDVVKPIPNQEVCQEFPDPTVGTDEYTERGTEQKGFEYRSDLGLGPATIDGVPTPEFRIGAIAFEKSEIVNSYYTASGNADSDEPARKYEEHETSNFLHAREYGVCGDGYAALGGERLTFKTSNGTAPTFDKCPDTL